MMNKILLRVYGGEGRGNPLGRKEHRRNIRRKRIGALEDMGQYSSQRKKPLQYVVLKKYINFRCKNIFLVYK